jgi:hypothetical protein
MDDSEIRKLMENIYKRKRGFRGQDFIIREICDQADIFSDQEIIYSNELLVMVVPRIFPDYNEIRISTRRVICDDGVMIIAIPYENIVDFGGTDKSRSDFLSKIIIRSKFGEKIVINVKNVDCRRALMSVLLNRARAAKPKVA